MEHAMKMNEIWCSVEIVVRGVGESQYGDTETEYMEETEGRATSKQKVVNNFGHQKSFTNGVNIIAIRWNKILLYQQLADLK